MGPSHFPLQARWTHEGRVEQRMIQNREDGMAIFSEVHTTDADAPTMVEYSDDRVGRAFAVGAGRSDTVLTFQASADPPYFVSRGNSRPSTEEIWFLYAGENTPYPGSQAVPIEIGVTSLAYFLDTGDRPQGIDWEQL